MKISENGGKARRGRYDFYYQFNMKASQMLKYPPAMQETWVQFLGWEDPLENGMATHSSILAWRIPSTEKPGWLQSMGHKAKITE